MPDKTPCDYCLKTGTYNVYHSGNKLALVCSTDKMRYMVPKSKRTMRALPNIKFFKVMDDEDKPFMRKGDAHMNLDQMHSVNAHFSAAQNPVTPKRHWSGVVTTYTVRGVGKKQLKEILG